LRDIYYIWGNEKYVNNVLVELEQERSLGRPRGAWADNIKGHLIDVRHEDAEEVRLAQDSSS
jgi:hypothetical protein